MDLEDLDCEINIVEVVLRQRPPGSLVVARPGNLDELVVAEWNAEAERIFGYTADEAVGRRLTDTIVSEPDARTFGRALGQESAPHRYTHLRKDGRAVVCAWRVAPVLDDGGRISAFR